MAVRSRLPWPWRAVAGVTLLAIVAGMWWWGFDFGQILGGFNRKEVETRITALETENAELRTQNTQLRGKAMQQESELAIATGAQASLSKQALELQNENSQVKEELVFLQKLVADSSKQVGLSIQRVVVEREREDAWHYSVLLVRGGSPKDEFEGHLTLQVTVQPVSAVGPAARPTIVTLPDEGTVVVLVQLRVVFQALAADHEHHAVVHVRGGLRKVFIALAADIIELQRWDHHVSLGPQFVDDDVDVLFNLLHGVFSFRWLPKLLCEQWV